jgi:hypothetical protein
MPTNAKTISGNSGVFQFPDVDLTSGDNALSTEAKDARGNTSSFSLTITRVPATPTGDPVLDWNHTLLEAIRLDDSAPPVAARNLAIVQGAVYDAVSSIQGTAGYFVHLATPAGTSAPAAVAAAANRALDYLYPAQTAALDSTLAASLAQVPDGEAKTNGIALGRAVANAVVALRAHDGYQNYVNYVPGSGPGVWQPTAPMYAEALLPQWATLQPFAMTSPDQFRPSGPPDLTSQAWTNAFNEVKELGSATSATRTADQTQIARFWADGGGSYTPPGHWNLIAEQVAQQQGNSLAANARLFAALDIAMADAAIVAWDAKYHFNAWRPITAIQAADSTGNPNVQADPNWTPLLITPPFPEYISGHSTFSAAAATILDSLLGSSIGFSTISQTLPGVTRTFAGFDAAAAEAGQSRIYAGIHFQFSNQDGQAAGRALASYVLGAFAVNQDTAPPAVVFSGQQPGVAVNSNFTITGQVTDRLSGVASLRVAVDQAAFSSVATDALGNFSVPTAFALDGTADGRHVLHFVALDAAGNSTAPIDFPVTLDTLAPKITLTNPPDGGNLLDGARIVGNLDGAGTALTAFSYTIDGGAVMPLALPNTGGAFSQALDLSRLTTGTHTLVVQASDAAGNAADHSVTFNLTAKAALTISEVTPMDGAVDVGVTVRPKVVFSRPVDPSTLTSSNFFASDSAGTKLPAAIVPANDGTFAWLFLTGPMPGASTITLTVDGSTIRTSDGALLDATGTGKAGSISRTRFTTVGQTSLAGTSLSGIVADPGPDLQPGTFDDVRRGPDGILSTADDIYVNPIAGVKVYILGHESEAVLTDSQGRFTFDAVPAGDIKLDLDGRTATNAPAGIYFPEMVMDLNIRAGVANTVMGTMGTPAESASLATVPGVYLPRLQTSLLHTVSAAAATYLGVDPISAPNLSPEQQQLLSIDIQPDSLVGSDGQKMSSAQIGISTVPPDLVRDMLPPGVLQHTLDITVQAPGVATFSTPAPVTAPNVFQAAPGTKLDFLSFDHTTGRLVIEGTATVSADGKTIHTDPGTGVTHPGWHGFPPPGTVTSSCGIPSSTTIFLPPVFDDEGTLTDHLFFEDGEKFQLSFDNAAVPLDESQDPCSPLNTEATPMTVVIESDTTVSEFLDGLAPQTLVLYPGQALDLSIQVKSLLANAKQIEKDRLYGAGIHVTAYEGDPSNPNGVFPFSQIFDKTIYLYRYLDAADPTHDDGILDFPSTLNDGVGKVQRNRPIEMILGAMAAQTHLSLDDVANFTYDVAQGNVIFDPTETDKNLTTDLQIIDPDSNKALDASGQSLRVRGEGTPQFSLFVNTAGLKSTLADIAAKGPNTSNVKYTLLTPDEIQLFDTPKKRQDIANQVLAGVKSKFEAVDNGSLKPGIVVTDAPGPNAISINWTTFANDPGAKIDPKIGFGYGDSQPGPADDGIDNRFAINTLVATYMDYSKTVQNFLMAKALNQSFHTNVDIYVNSPLENHTAGYPTLWNTDQFVNALVKTTAHESAHTLGAVHTAQVKPKAIRLEYQTLLVGSDPYTLSFNGYSTDPKKPIPIDATKDVIQAALEGLPSIGPGNVQVDFVSPGDFNIIFKGDLVFFNLPPITGAGTNGGDPQITISQDPDSSEIIGGNGKWVINSQSGSSGTDDIMYGGHLDTTGSLNFLPGLTLDVLKLGLKLGWTPDQADNALNVDVQNVGLGGFDGTLDPDLPGAADGPHLAELDSGGHLTQGTVDFGTVSVDGPGQSGGAMSLGLFNYGTDDIVLTDVQLVDPASSYHLSPVMSGAIVKPGDTLPLDLTFDPLTSGDLHALLRVQSNDPLFPKEISLHGFGLSPVGDIRLSVLNNNVGADRLGGALQTVPNFATVSNIGAGPLTVIDIMVANDSGQFLPVGLPPGLGAGQPLVIQPGKTFRFDLSFAAKYLGLQRGDLEIVSDDPETPMIRQGIVGTALPAQGTVLQYGDDFVALETPFVSGSPVLRQKSDSAGNWSFFMPGQTAYHYAIFDPVSGLIAHGYGTSAVSGFPTDLGTPVFKPSSASDSDGDGLPDDVEFAIGTSPNKVDTSGDGLSDFVKVQEGLDPFAGNAATTGVTANLVLTGEARKIVFAGSTETPSGLTAYVAAGTGGLAVVDVTKIDKPIVVSQMPLPGNAVDIALDSLAKVAAVASPGAGLNLVDVADRTAPHLLVTVPIFADHVQAFGGIAYVTSGPNLLALDIRTGRQLQMLSYPNTNLTGIERENGFLYLMSDDLTLRVVEIVGLKMVDRGSLKLPDGGAGFVVGNGIAYVMAPNVQVTGGYFTVDVSDPNQPKLIVGPNQGTRPLPRVDLALNGSGKAVLLDIRNDDPRYALNVFNSSDPTITDGFLTRLPLASLPISVAMAAGVAYVAEGQAGLQVVNVLPFDAQGQPPTVSVLPEVADADANKPGIQVVEGTAFPVEALVDDDVQVRDVQLLVNGQPIQDSVSFPFNLSAIAPQIVGQTNTFTIQVRATDTGGNSTLSAAVTLELLPDTTPPTLLQTDPLEGEVKPRNFHAPTITFSEPIAAVDVTSSNFTLLDANGQPVPPSSVGSRGDGSIVQMVLGDLGPGNYQLVIHAAGIHDRAGNALGAVDIVRHFTIDPYSIRFQFNVSNEFLDPNNWDQKRVPGPDDYVLIDAPVPPYVQLNPFNFPGETVTVKELTVNTQLRIEVGGDLTVTGKLLLNSALAFNAGTLHKATLVAGTNAKVFNAGFPPQVDAFGNQCTWDAVTATGDFDMIGSGITVINGLTLDGTANGAAFLQDREDTFIDGSGTILNGRILLENSVALKLGESITFRGQAPLNQIQITNGSSLVNLGAILADGPNATTLVQFSRNPGDPATPGLLINNGDMEAVNGGQLRIVDANSDDPPGLNFINNKTLHVATASTLIVLRSQFISATTQVDTGGTAVLSGTLVTPSNKTSILLGGGDWFVNGIDSGGQSQHPENTSQSFFTGGGAVVLKEGAILKGSLVLKDVTLDGDLELTQTYDIPPSVSANNNEIIILGNVNIIGTLTLGDAAGTFETHVLFASQTASLGGDCTIVFGASPMNIFASTFVCTAFSIGPNVTIGGNYVHVGNYALSSAIYTNHGTISATDGTILIDGSWQNPDGHINSVNSHVMLGGSFSSADIAGFERTGGVVDLIGTLHNSGATLLLNADTGPWNLLRGRVIGGTVSSADGAEVTGTSKAGFLSNVTLDGQLDLPNEQGAIVNADTATVRTGTIGIGSRAIFASTTFGQQSGGTLAIAIGGSPASKDFGLLQIAGNASLDGTLALSLANGFTPSLGDVYTIVTAGGIGGTFANVTGLDIGNGTKFVVGYAAKKVTLTVVAGP